MTRSEELRLKIREGFGDEAAVYRAPGRVNLIGEHTDYNDGFVFPAAIDLFAWIAIAPRSDRRIHLQSENFGQAAELDLDMTRINT